jgi:hypothetical protein
MTKPPGSNLKGSKYHRKRISIFLRGQANSISIWMHLKKKRTKSSIRYMDNGSIWNKM